MSFRHERQIAELSAVVHGALVALHVLGVAYNVRRKNWYDVGAHALAAGYDCYAVHRHVQDVCEIAHREAQVSINDDDRRHPIYPVAEDV